MRRSNLAQRRLHFAVPAAAVSAAIAVLYKFPPSQYPIYPPCPFYAITHRLCPGCGGTRALYELLHMNLPGALHYNALVTLLAPLAVIWLAWGCYRSYRYGQFPPVPWPRSTAFVLGAVALAFAVIRDSGVAFVM